MTLAADGLRCRFPHFSAAVYPGDARARVVAVFLFVFVGTAYAAITWPLVAMALSLPFAALVLLRVAAVAFLVDRTRVGTDMHGTGLSDDALPSYTLLVPLYREAAIAARLVGGLDRLDYPRSKLQILFLTEADDHATRRALHAARPPNWMQIITVPDGQPRTKPRALNVGLQAAKGTLIGVYDAEDVPQPDQLRCAALAFAVAAEAALPLSCVQARLEIDNADASLWSRLFAAEYATLFDALLPALRGLGFPIPLSGTSNHFRREDLVSCGGWDAYNVTEDADLGYRFARLGRRTELLQSVTFEEAPVTARVWLGQRKRWLKGWMQTMAVHFAEPRRLLRDLGFWQAFGLALALGGMVLSALVHPWTYALLLAVAMGGIDADVHEPLTALALFNLIVGYAAGIGLTFAVAMRRGDWRLAGTAFLIPLYWVVISVAAYAALIDFVRRPFHWQKTPHGVQLSGRQAD